MSSTATTQGPAVRYPVFSESELERFLTRGAKTDIQVTATDNRVCMLSITTLPGQAKRVRLHRAFLAAPPDILLILKRYLHRNATRDWERLKQYARNIPDLQHPPQRHTQTCRLRTKGNYYDLAEIHRRVNQRFFEGAVKSLITWGRRGPRRRGKTRSIRFGSYDPQLDLIRIHPSLDDPRAPADFLDYITFHEMLHAVEPPRRSRGRWLYHHADFKSRERTFPDWERMQDLSKALLETLSS